MLCNSSRQGRSSEHSRLWVGDSLFSTFLLLLHKQYIFCKMDSPLDTCTHECTYTYACMCECENTHTHGFSVLWPPLLFESSFILHLSALLAMHNNRFYLTLSLTYRMCFVFTLCYHILSPPIPDAPIPLPNTTPPYSLVPFLFPCCFWFWWVLLGLFTWTRTRGCLQ